MGTGKMGKQYQKETVLKSGWPQAIVKYGEGETRHHLPWTIPSLRKPDGDVAITSQDKVDPFAHEFSQKRRNLIDNSQLGLTRNWSQNWFWQFYHNWLGTGFESGNRFLMNTECGSSGSRVTNINLWRVRKYNQSPKGAVNAVCALCALLEVNNLWEIY